MAAYAKFSLLALCLLVAAVSGRPQQSPQPLQYILLQVPPQVQQPTSAGLNPPPPKARDFWGESQDASKIAQRLPTQTQEIPGQFSSTISRQSQPLGQNSFQAQPASFNSQAVAPQFNSDPLLSAPPQPWNAFNSGNI